MRNWSNVEGVALIPKRVPIRLCHPLHPHYDTARSGAPHNWRLAPIICERLCRFKALALLHNDSVVDPIHEWPAAIGNEIFIDRLLGPAIMPIIINDQHPLCCQRG